MMRGETVEILRPTITGADEYGEQLPSTVERVENVLVGSPSPSDVASSGTPDGLSVSLPLYFPRSYRGGSLRGCKVRVRGDEYRVVGDPMPLDGGLTPTAWNMQVTVHRDDGR